MLTTDVENYPGFPEGVTGPEMMELFQKQAERFGTQRPPRGRDRASTSRSARSGSRPRSARFPADALILATGASAQVARPRLRDSAS